MKAFSRIAVAALAGFSFLTGSVSAAGLFHNAGSGPRIFIGEVQSYGDYELKREAFDTFADKLYQNMTAKNFQVVSRADMTNEAGRHDEGNSEEDTKLSVIHMDAIIHGHWFEHGEAAAKLVRYADAAMGRKYFYDDVRIENWRKQSGVPYRLSPAVAQQAEQIAQTYGAQYMLFVNLKDVDVRLKHTMFASRTERETRGKKVTAVVDYYLLNTANGKVFEGHCENKKTAQLMNFAIVKNGKGMNVDEMLNQVMAAQVEDIVADLNKNGMKAVQ